MKLGIKVFYFLLGLLIFIACAPRAEVPQPRSEDKTTVPQAPAKEAWEKAWNEIVREAQKEGTVVVYGIPIESREPFAKSLKEKFGLKMEILTGQGPVVGAKILSERRGGIFITDIFIAGPATPLVQLKPQGAFDSIEPELVLPEVKDPKSWRGGGIRFLDKDRLVVAASTFIQLTLAYNNSIINPEEVKSYSSLLNPRWKGKISISDATIAGPGWAWFGAMEEGIPGGKEFLRQVVKQEPAIIRDYRLQVEWLAQGKYPIALAPFTPTVEDFKKVGAPIGQLIPEEGGFLTSGQGNIALMNKAFHPNAARLFLNYFLTREGQTIYSQATGYVSSRLDVPTTGLSPLTVPDLNKKYFYADTEDFILRSPEHRQLAREIFAPLLR